MIYGSETWPTKVEDMQRLERTERMMIRWMCGVTLKNRVSSDDLRVKLGIDSVSDMVRRSRLRGFGHVERKSAEDWVSACRELVVEGVKGKGRSRKSWKECVADDMRKLRLRKEDAQNCVLWRCTFGGKRLTHAGMENRRKTISS